MPEQNVPIRAMHAAPSVRERDETCPKGPVIGTPFLLVDSCLFLGPLLLCLLLAPGLVPSPHATDQGPGGGTNGSPFARITGYCSTNGSHCSASSRSTQQPSLPRFLLGWRGSGLGLLHRVKTGLIFGPPVTLILVLFYLLLALAFSRVNK